MNALVPVNANVEAYRASTDAAQLCKDIVVATASTIQGKRYVSVEGWEAIARAHGCAAGATNVRRVEGGIAATGEVRDMFSGNIIANGEGFVGEDEPVWFGGETVDKWGKKKIHPKRADYAIRAMAQTRAISRACRSAFAHVVVMMNAGLATTPAEEVPAGGFDDTPHNPQTGEVIEARAEPVPGITKIKERLRLMMTAGNAPDMTLDAFKDLKRANKDDLKTIRDANHTWWTGDGEDFEGFGPWIARRETELTPAKNGGTVAERMAAIAEEDGQFAMLIKSMKECDTKAALESWLIANEAIVAELDGAESRKFELAYDLHASAITQMDVARA